MSQFAIIAENDESPWEDVKGEVYHYPNTYKEILTPGCKVIYYKGKMTLAELRFLKDICGQARVYLARRIKVKPLSTNLKSVPGFDKFNEWKIPGYLRREGVAADLVLLVLAIYEGDDFVLASCTSFMLDSKEQSFRYYNTRHYYYDNGRPLFAALQFNLYNFPAKLSSRKIQVS